MYLFDASMEPLTYFFALEFMCFFFNILNKRLKNSSKGFIYLFNF